MVHLSHAFVVAAASVLLIAVPGHSRPSDRWYDMSGLRWDLEDSYNPPSTYNDDSLFRAQNSQNQLHHEDNFRYDESIDPRGKYTVPPEYHAFDEEDRHHGVDTTPLTTPPRSPVQEGDTRLHYYGGQSYLNHHHDGQTRSHQLPEDWYQWGDNGIPIVKPIKDYHAKKLGIRYKNKLEEAEQYSPYRSDHSNSDAEGSDYRETPSEEVKGSKKASSSRKGKSKWWRI